MLSFFKIVSSDGNDSILQYFDISCQILFFMSYLRPSKSSKSSAVCLRFSFFMFHEPDENGLATVCPIMVQVQGMVRQAFPVWPYFSQPSFPVWGIHPIQVLVFVIFTGVNNFFGLIWRYCIHIASLFMRALIVCLKKFIMYAHRRTLCHKSNSREMQWQMLLKQWWLPSILTLVSTNVIDWCFD